MTDEINQLNNNINEIEFQLLKWISPEPNNPKFKVDTLKYTPDEVVMEVNNYRNDSKNSVSSAENYKMDDLISELEGMNSQLNTDNNDRKKLTNHIVHKVVDKIAQLTNYSRTPTTDYINELIHSVPPKNTMRMGESSGTKSTQAPNLTSPNVKKEIQKLWNNNSYDYNAFHKDSNTYENPSQSWKMASGVLNYLQYSGQAKSFLSNHTKKHKGYMPFNYNGKTFYFPPKMEYSSELGLVNLTKKIQQNYQGPLDKAKTQSKLTNNLYKKLWHSLYTKNLKSSSSFSDNQTLNDENNHPTVTASGSNNMVKALTNYQYQIQKDRIWQQYHQDQINHMTDYAKDLEEKRDHIQQSINWDYAHHHMGNNYKKIVAKRDHLNDLINNRLPTDYVNNLKAKQAEVQAAINKYYKEHKQKSSACLNLIRKRNRLNVLMKNSPRSLKNFYNQEVEWRDGWKQKADELQNRWHFELQKEQDEANYTATIDNLNADPRNGHFAYIRPVNPDTQDSYVFMMVTEESPQHSTEATSNPIEWGRNVTTGTQQQPTSVSVSGYLFNDNLPQSADDGHASQEPNNGHGLDPVKQDDENIADWSDAGAEVFYSGIHMFPHCTITSWNPDYNTGGDGSLTSCSFSMTLQLNTYFQSNSIPSKNGKSRDRGGKKKSRGKRSAKPHKHFYRVKAGQNLSTIALRKHIPLSKLERANHKTIYKSSRSYNLIYPGQKLIIPR